jgi:TPR repeat protein
MTRRVVYGLVPVLLLAVAVVVSATVAELLGIPSPWRYVWFAGVALVVSPALGRLKKRLDRRVADNGDVKKMFKLGVEAELEGRDEEAEEWYGRAAEAGNTEAMGKLGDLLAEPGRGEAAAPRPESTTAGDRPDSQRA